jgi:hypothetical protein
LETEMKTHFAQTAALASLALLLAAPAFAASTEFNVPVSGAHEMPAVAHTGSGIAQLTYDPASRLLGWSFKYKGFHSPVTMVHFHQAAAPGESGPPVVWISKKGEAKLPNPITGHAVLTPDQARAFEAGQWYINVHTKGHPAGAAAGPVTPPKS